MPYINEDLKRQTQAVLKQTGLDNIRVHYINGCSSSRIFTPPKEKQCCPDPCDTCGSSITTNQCLTKNCVYKIKCSHMKYQHIFTLSLKFSGLSKSRSLPKFCRNFFSPEIINIEAEKRLK